MSNKVVLCIMDGFGIREEKYGNAIKSARTPNLDYLIEKYSDDGIHLNHNGFVVWSAILKPMLI